MYIFIILPKNQEQSNQAALPQWHDAFDNFFLKKKKII